MGVKVTKEQELGIDKNRKKFDIREEYFVSTSPPPLSLVSILSRGWFVSGWVLRWMRIGSQSGYSDQRGYQNGVYPQPNLRPNRLRHHVVRSLFLPESYAASQGDLWSAASTVGSYLSGVPRCGRKRGGWPFSYIARKREIASGLWIRLESGFFCVFRGGATEIG